MKNERTKKEKKDCFTNIKFIRNNNAYKSIMSRDNNYERRANDQG